MAAGPEGLFEPDDEPPGPEGKSRIGGRVLLADGSPCSDARVGTYALGLSAVTDAEGRFLLEGVPSRRLVDLHVTCSESARLPPFRVTGVRPGTENVELRFEATVTIEGTVVDPYGAPVTDGFVCVVRADGGLPLTEGSNSTFFYLGSDGRFTVTGIAAVPHRIWARSSARIGAERRVDAPAREVRLVLAPPRIVTGRLTGAGSLGDFELVALAPDGPDPGNVRVTGQARSEADGSFRLELRVDGPYEIHATRSNEDRVGRVAGVPSGATSVVVPLETGLSIEGELEMEGGRSLPDDVWISASAHGSGEVQPAEVQAGGRFRVHGLLPGRYRVQAGSLSRPGVKTTAIVPAGATGVRLELPAK